MFLSHFCRKCDKFVNFIFATIQVIDPIAPRYTALACTENPVRVTVAENVPEESKEVPQHPKVTL